MPRLRNKATNSVVNVSEDKAARLGSEWAPIEVEAEKPRTRAKKAESKDS